MIVVGIAPLFSLAHKPSFSREDIVMNDSRTGVYFCSFCDNLVRKVTLNVFASVIQTFFIQTMNMLLSMYL